MYHIQIIFTKYNKIIRYDRAKQLGGENMETILVGNKNDIDDSLRQVDTLEGENKALELGIPFVGKLYKIL